MSNTDTETKDEITQQTDAHDIAIQVIAQVIAVAILFAISVLFKIAGRFYDWSIWQEWDFKPLIAIVVSAAFVISAVILTCRNREKKKRVKVIALILSVLGIVLLLNSVSVALRPQIKAIDRLEISRESLLRQYTIDIPITKPYRALTLEIERTGRIPSIFPEMELAKISTQSGNWESPLEKVAVEKLNIPGLEAANEDELFYRLVNGTFRVQEVNGSDASLNEENKIRVNVRNFAGFEDTITLTFYGIPRRGANKRKRQFWRASCLRRDWLRRLPRSGKFMTCLAGQCMGKGIPLCGYGMRGMGALPFTVWQARKSRVRKAARVMCLSLRINPQ